MAGRLAGHSARRTRRSSGVVTPPSGPRPGAAVHRPETGFPRKLPLFHTASIATEPGPARFHSRRPTAPERQPWPPRRGGRHADRRTHAGLSVAASRQALIAHEKGGNRRQHLALRGRHVTLVEPQLLVEEDALQAKRSTYRSCGRSAYRSHPRRPCPSVRRTAPEPGAHGRIADGGGPESRLGTHNRRSVARDSDRRSGL